MPTYTCNSCLYTTDSKSNLNKHISTQKHLFNTHRFRNKKKLISVVSSASTDNKTTCVPSIPSIPNRATKKMYMCSHCGLTFNDRSNLYRHKTKTCKLNKDVVKQKITSQEITIIELRKELNKYTSNHTQQLDIDNNQSNNVNSHNIHNIHNDNRVNTVNNMNSNNVNSNNTIQNNLIVNNFGYGRDDWSHVTEKMYIDFLKKPMSMISAAFKAVNLNKDVPQNHNIRVSNRRSGKVLVWEDAMWNNHEKEGTMSIVVDEKYYEIDNFFRNMMKNNPERLKQLMTDAEIRAYINFSDNFDKEMNAQNVNDPSKQPLNTQFREDCFYRLVDILDNANYNGEFFDSLTL